MTIRRIIAGILALTLLLALLPAALADTGTPLAHEHIWRESSRTEPTCTKDGSVTYGCSCGETRTERIPKTGHSWGQWQTTREATCAHAGEQVRKCRVCGTKDTRKVDKLAHTWGEWTVTLEPTDFTMGTRAHTCKVCGTEKSADFYPNGTYKRGDSGEDVRELQEKLNAAGYDCGAADGIFGKKTEAAVKALEEAHGFTADGIAWPGVQKWLAVGQSGPVVDLRNLPAGGFGPDAPGLYVEPLTYLWPDGFSEGVILRYDVTLLTEETGMAMSGGRVDMFVKESWMTGTLRAFDSYSFTYNMALDPKKSGWSDRTVTVTLRSRSLGCVEKESVTLTTPFKPAKVTLVTPGGDDHIIGDYMAWLYLSIDLSTSVQGQPGEWMSVPLSIETEGNTDGIQNIKLVCETDWNGKPFYRESISITDFMRCNTVKDFMAYAPVRMVEGQWKEYTLTFYLTGEIYNDRGKLETITPEPITKQLSLRNPDQSATKLDLSLSLSPARSRYLPGDIIFVHCQVKSVGTAPAHDVTVYLMAKSDENQLMPVDQGTMEAVRGWRSPGNTLEAPLEPGRIETLTYEYRVTEADAQNGRFDLRFQARAVEEDGIHLVYSAEKHFTLKASYKAPEELIHLSAAPVEPAPSAYQAGLYYRCMLTVTNTSDRELRSIRLYAVGDNRGTEYLSGHATWFDLGHGMKGLMQMNWGNIDLGPGESTQISVPATIPESWPVGYHYLPTWKIDGELADSTPVRSCAATMPMLVEIAADEGQPDDDWPEDNPPAQTPDDWEALPDDDEPKG